MPGPLEGLPELGLLGLLRARGRGGGDAEVVLGLVQLLAERGVDGGEALVLEEEVLDLAIDGGEAVLEEGEGGGRREVVVEAAKERVVRVGRRWGAAEERGLVVAVNDVGAPAGGHKLERKYCLLVATC